MAANSGATYHKVLNVNNEAKYTVCIYATVARLGR